MPGKSKVKLSTLNLVYPPISNRIASIGSDNERFAATISQSDFYMIGGRAKASFANLNYDANEGLVRFDIVIPGGPSSSGAIDVYKIKRIGDDERDEFPVGVHGNDDYIIIDILSDDGDEERVAAYSPESVLMLVGRKEPGAIVGFKNYMEMSTYDLLYVGIAKKGDTFSRLIEHGHHARQKILSEEPQRFPGALVTDEIFIFPFTVDPMFINTFGADSEIEDGDLDFSYNNKKIVADAEKAFVSLLKPPYNKQLFANYPRGADGLYGDGLNSYSYSIAEGLRFRTSWGEFDGARDFMSDFSNDADSIIVKGDEITIYVAKTKDFVVWRPGAAQGDHGHRED